MDTGKLTTIYESGFAVANELPYEGLVSASCQLICKDMPTAQWLKTLTEIVVAEEATPGITVFEGCPWNGEAKCITPSNILETRQFSLGRFDPGEQKQYVCLIRIEDCYADELREQLVKARVNVQAIEVQKG